MATRRIGRGQVGVVEEVGEGFGQAFGRVERVALFTGTGHGPVEERVPGYDAGNAEGCAGACAHEHE